MGLAEVKEEEEFREAHVLMACGQRLMKKILFSARGNTDSSADIVGMWKLDELLNVIMSSTQETLLKYIRR